MRMRSIGLFIWLISFILVGCQRPKTPEEKFAYLFADYDLIKCGSIPTEADWRLNATNGDFSEISETSYRPKKFLPGTVYVFNKHVSTNDQTEGLQRLPARLGKVGAVLNKYPRSDGDMFWTYFGGPLFSIEFTLNQRDAVMFNYVQVDPPRKGLVIMYR
jgi:hypothetical protein